MKPLISRSDLGDERDFRRLKTRHPICLLCGFNELTAALQRSHVIPRQFGIHDAIIECLNCHCITSEMEKTMSYSPKTARPDFERMGRYFLALANRSEKFAATVTEFGEQLLEFAAQEPKQTNGGDRASDD